MKSLKNRTLYLANWIIGAACATIAVASCVRAVDTSANPPPPSGEYESTDVTSEAIRDIPGDECYRLHQEALAAAKRGDKAQALAKLAEADKILIDPLRAKDRAEVFRLLADDRLELEALLEMIDPKDGAGFAGSSQDAWLARALALADQTGQNIESRLDMEHRTVSLPGGRVATLAELKAEGLAPRDAADLAELSRKLSAERYEEVLTQSNRLIQKTGRAEAYVARSHARRALDPNDPEILRDLRQAYARGNAQMRAHVGTLYGTERVRDWPKTPEELEHP